MGAATGQVRTTRRGVFVCTSSVVLALALTPAFAQQVVTDIDRSERLFLQGRFEEAEAVLDAVADRSSATRLVIAAQRSKIEIFRGLLARETERYESALSILSSEGNVLAETEDANVRGTYTAALAYANLYNGNSDSALRQFRDAAALHSAASNPHAAALDRAFDVMMRLGVHRRNRDSAAMVEMIPELVEEIDLARQAGNEMAVAYNERHLAAIHREGAGDLTSALNLYRASLETRRRIGFLVLLPASYSSVGDVLADMGNTRAAIEMYEKAIVAARDVGFHRYELDPRIRIGDLFRSEGSDEEARDAYCTALRTADAQGFVEGIEQVRARLASLDRRR